MFEPLAEDERAEIKRLVTREIEDVRGRLHALLHDSAASAKETAMVQSLTRPFYEEQLCLTYKRLLTLTRIVERVEGVAA